MKQTKKKDQVYCVETKALTNTAWHGKTVITLILNTISSEQEYPHEKIVEDIITAIQSYPTQTPLLLIGSSQDPLLRQNDLLQIVNALPPTKIMIVCAGGVMPDSLLRPLISLWNVRLPPQQVCYEDPHWSEEAFTCFSGGKESHKTVFEWSVKDKKQVDDVINEIRGVVDPTKTILSLKATLSFISSLHDYAHRTAEYTGVTVGGINILGGERGDVVWQPFRK